jgi:hypothetical protein
MRIEQSDKSRDLVNVSVLLSLALFVGIYLITTTAIISKDGTIFITYAKQLDSAFVRTLKNEYQHPGYPSLIVAAHKVTDLWHKNTSILSWIYCAQSIALIFRLLAITVLYFIAKHLFEAKTGFWAILILILLPLPAKYGSDALSDWPNLFFFVAGLLLLFKVRVNNKWWIFGFTGLMAGAGYLIRPECAMLVILSGLWLGLQLLWPQRSMSKGHVLSALVSLIIGFLVITGPYMMLKGAIFPKKNVGRFSQSSKQPDVHTKTNLTVSEAALASQYTPLNITRAFNKLVQNTGETLMWFFVPAMFIGMYKKLKAKKWHEPEKFFIFAIIAIYISLMTWLYCKYGYMSKRHTLPLLIIPILYIPAGLHELAIWLQEKLPSKAKTSAAATRDQQFWFLVLFLIGASICTVKLLGSYSTEKHGYRAAAEWLKANTDNTAIVAVPDIRISFYAQRKGILYVNEEIPANAAYIVRISEDHKDETALTKAFGKVEYEYVSKSKKQPNIIIYRNT